MKRFIIAALLAAACSPVPPTVGKDWDAIITVNGQSHKFKIHTTRPVEEVQRAVAYCSQGVFVYGIESVPQCLTNEGFKPIYTVQ